MNLQDNHLRLILDNLPALVAILDTQQRYRFANKPHVTWFGEDPDALAGRHVRDVIGEEAYNLLRAHYEKALEGESSTFTGEVPFARGGNRFVHAARIPLCSDDGVIEGVLVLCTDLTELTMTQRALDASSLRSRTILDTAVDAIITIDESGTVQSANESTERLFGYKPDEMIGNNVSMLMPDPYATAHDGYLERYLTTGEKRIIGIGREVMARRKDGTQFPIHLAVGEFTEGGRRYFTGFIRDMTPQKEAEKNSRAHLEQLAHVSRLSAIDNLASGISHEINQPLTAIVTMSQALLRGLRAGRSDPAMLEDTLERIVHQGARANSIVQQMRELARRDTSSEQSDHQVDAIIVEVLKLLDYEIQHNKVDIQMDLNTDGTMVQVNRIQVEQVLMNLIQNAVHAMSEVNGERILSIVTNPPSAEHPYVEVLVGDTGTGLPDHAEANVFDPFFTTKEQGMGQGLSISRSIIESHGGILIGGANGGGGALFKFTLPAGDGADE